MTRWMLIALMTLGAWSANAAAETPENAAADFDAEFETIGNALAADLAALSPDDQTGRSALLGRVRRAARRFLMRYSETADFKYLTHDDDGVLLQVVGTEKGGLLQSGDRVYVYGALPPNVRQFRASIYPGGICGNYAGRSGVLFYGADQEYALEILLYALGSYVGNPALFQLPAAATAAQNIYVDNSTVNNVTNIYVKPRPPYWVVGWGAGMSYAGSSIRYGGSSGTSSVSKTSPGASTRIAIPSRMKR